MNTMLPGLLSIALYLLASGLLLVRLAHGTRPVRPTPGYAILAALAAILVHTILLYPSIITPRWLNLGFVHAASLIALTSAALLAVSTIFQPVGNLGIAIFPVAAISIAAAFSAALQDQ